VCDLSAINNNRCKIHKKVFYSVHAWKAHVKFSQHKGCGHARSVSSSINAMFIDIIA